MEYVSFPANLFYFVLGNICGMVSLIIILNIYANNKKKKDMETFKKLFNMTNDENKNEK